MYRLVVRFCGTNFLGIVGSWLKGSVVYFVGKSLCEYLLVFDSWKFVYWGRIFVLLYFFCNFDEVKEVIVLLICLLCEWNAYVVGR